ncbi:MAG: MarR family transcriptional regulator [Hyphomicrobiaceae bacterium]|nr:MarR family transcriptional regulator [Hyphomicrobiaceae bacterium]
MTDINPRARDDTAKGEAACSRKGPPDDPRLVAMVELLFFAYRDFVGEPDAILAEIGFGRAHHRVLHFVNRNPGLRVADLLGILKITKQSLARVLKQLVDEGYIEQATGASDRRERRLHLTTKGRNLATRLLDLQTQRLGKALAAAGPGSEQAAAAFLAGVIEAPDQAAAAALVARATGGGRQRAP